MSRERTHQKSVESERRNLIFLQYLIAILLMLSLISCSPEKNCSTPSIDDLHINYHLPVIIVDGELVGSGIVIENNLFTIGHIARQVDSCAHVVTADGRILKIDNSAATVIQSDASIDTIVAFALSDLPENKDNTFNISQQLIFGDEIYVYDIEGNKIFGTIVNQGKPSENIPGLVYTVKMAGEVCHGQSGAPVYFGDNIVGLVYGGRPIPPENPFGDCFDDSFLVFVVFPTISQTD